MIKHIIKIILTERKTNIWILFELILVFCILWFCTDYISFYTKRYLEPTGFDIDNVYHISLGVKEEGLKIISSEDNARKDELMNNIQTIFDRIKQYPEIETACISQWAVPYSDSFSSDAISIDSIIDYPQIKRVTPEFFEVFKINMLKGRVYNWNDISGENYAIISGDKDNIILGRPIEQLPDTIRKGDNTDSPLYKIIGIAQKTKKGNYNPYNKILYLPLKMNNPDIININHFEISVRVKPDIENGFETRFSKNMQQQIGVGPYFMVSVSSAEKLRDKFMIDNGYDNDFKSIFSVSAFLLINIFLGVVGTFWFRVQTRRNEIGLRMALGATKRNIKKQFMTETLLLLFFASLIASVICFNISITDILEGIDIPTIDGNEKSFTVGRHLANYIFTFLTLSVIAGIAVWYPAKRASSICPAQSLKDE